MAVQVYNREGLKYAAPSAGSKLERFLLSGPYVAAPEGIKRITPQESTTKSGPIRDPILYQYYGLAYALGLWWKFVGYPSWTELIIGIALFHAITIGLCYILLRQFSGFVLSTLSALLLGLNHVMLYFALCNFRDSSRLLFIVASFLLLAILLKPFFSWKRTIVSGIAGGLLLFIGMGFRSDFLFLVPFIIIAVFLFHGKSIWGAWLHKAIFSVLLLAIPFILSATLIPKTTKIPNNQHVTYIGLSPELLDVLSAPNPHYYWGRWYSDIFGFVAGNTISYQRYNLPNEMPNKPENYAKALNGELVRLAYYYPYDLSMSALACIFNGTVKAQQQAESLFKMTSNMPFYQAARIFSKGLLEHIPSWVVAGVIFLFLICNACFSYRRFLFFLIMGMLFLGMYAIQFSLRHYYFHLLLPCVCAAFVGTFIWRLIFTLLHFRKKALQYWSNAMPRIGSRLGGALLTFSLLGIILLGLKIWQNHVLAVEIERIPGLLQTRLTIKTSENTSIPEDAANVIFKRDVKNWEDIRNGNVFLTFPALGEEVLKAKNPRAPWNTWGYGEYLVCYFDLTKSDLSEIPIWVHYQLKGQSRPLAILNPTYLNKTRDFSEKLELPISTRDTYVMVLPIYFGNISSFCGIELSKEARKSLAGAFVFDAPAEMFAHVFIWSPISRKNFPKLNRFFTLQDVFQLNNKNL